jgi:NTP pyrophosphatase (non-canonical NTP hydrolase)
MATLEDLIKKIIRAKKERGWYPVAADCAKSIVIEAAELLEHFQWDRTDENKHPKDWKEIELEVADIFWYLVAFCQDTKIDLAECVQKKLRHVDKKYPANMFNGKHNEKFYRKQKRKYRGDSKKKLE